MPVIPRAARVDLFLLAVPGAGQVASDFFGVEHLDEIRLTMDSADWRKLHDNYTDKKTTYAAELSWRGLTLRSVGIHTRGSGSLNPIMPGLAIEFDRFVPGQSLLGLQSLILRNMWGDPSTLHEYLTMRVLERLGMPFQRTAHVRVMVNGEYEIGRAHV